MDFSTLCEKQNMAEMEFDERMVNAGFGRYTHISTDWYDNSIEFYGVGNDARLNAEHMAIISEAGFGKVYLNHEDGWETGHPETDADDFWRNKRKQFGIGTRVLMWVQSLTHNPK